MNSRLFSRNHIWISEEENKKVKLGISDYAQEEIGSIMFLNLPEKGDIINIGEPFGDIESIKTVSDLISPISGKVIDVNTELVDSPDGINNDPYGNWMCIIEVSEQIEMMTAAQYEEYLKTL